MRRGERGAGERAPAAAGRARRSRARPAVAHADRLARHLLALSTAIRDRISARLLARGWTLGPAATQVLPNLPLEGLGMSELAARLRLTLQRTGQLVQELEAAGYVARAPDPRDGRAKRAVYTRRGRALVADADAVMAEVSAELAAVVGAAPFARLAATLARLDAAVNGEDAALLLPPRR